MELYQLVSRGPNNRVSISSSQKLASQTARQSMYKLIRVSGAGRGEGDRKTATSMPTSDTDRLALPQINRREAHAHTYVHIYTHAYRRACTSRRIDFTRLCKFLTRRFSEVGTPTELCSVPTRPDTCGRAATYYAVSRQFSRYTCTSPTPTLHNSGRKANAILNRGFKVGL